MLLEARGIRLRLGARPVLDGIDVAFGRGELVGLIGPNGAGKSTLLRVLARLIQPSDGSVRCDGRPLGGIPATELARQIAYLPQGGSAYWPMAVENVVALGRLPYRRRWGGLSGEDRAAVARAMAATDVAALVARATGTLSGGERMRVMLARALAVEAPILLADEPIAALDPLHQLRAMALLRQVAHEGAAVVAAIHDLTLAARFCDRLVLLHQGRVLADGGTAEVLDEPHVGTAFRVSTVRGSHLGEDYVIPWNCRPEDG